VKEGRKIRDELEIPLKDGTIQAQVGEGEQVVIIMGMEIYQTSLMIPA
jgi:hypothetical protein